MDDASNPNSLTQPSPEAGGGEVAVLIMHCGDHVLDYALGEVSGIGRLPENSVCLHDTIASRRHAEVRRLGNGGYEIVDLGSTHGTYVNREAVQRQDLKKGDEVIIGATRLTFAYKTVTEVHARRQHTRVPCSLPVRVALEGHGFDTSVVDISLSGARLAWDHPVALGMQLALKITFPRRWRRLALRARTIYFSEQDLGVVFTDASTQQQKALAKELLHLFVGQAQ